MSDAMGSSLRVATPFVQSPPWIEQGSSLESRFSDGIVCHGPWFCHRRGLTDPVSGN